MIEFRNVSKVYNNGTEALHNINLTVEKGEFVFIVGSTGAGKSTFLKLVIRAKSGRMPARLSWTAWMLPASETENPLHAQKDGHCVPGFPPDRPHDCLRQRGLCHAGGGRLPDSIHKRVPYILSLVGLQHKAKHYPTEMSGGERQRVGLARALVNNPSMIIADEPTGNIDPALSYEIVDLLSAINERGTTVLMVTHEHSLVKHFHKRIIQIHSGEIVADTAAISKEQQAAAQAVATQETVAVDREAIRRAKEARAKADADAQPYATKEFTAPQNNDQANG